MAEPTFSESEARLEDIKRRAKTMAEQHFLPPDDDIHFLLNLIDALRSQVSTDVEEAVAGFHEWWFRWRTSEVPAADCHTSLRETARAGWAAGGKAMRRACVQATLSFANEPFMDKGDFLKRLAVALGTVTPEEGENDL